MAGLSQKEKEILARRGVKVSSGVRSGDTSAAFSPVGLCWLFNYLRSSDSVGSPVSTTLLGKLADIEPDANWRELRIKASTLPVDEDRDAYQLTAYLNGTPPKAISNFGPFNTIKSEFDTAHVINGYLKSVDELDVQVLLSDEQRACLEAGGFVAAGFEKGSEEDHRARLKAVGHRKP